MGTDSDGFSTSEDPFDDEAIKRELLRILQDDEARMLALMDARKSDAWAQAEVEIRNQPETLREKYDEAWARIMDRLDAAKVKLSRNYMKMRDFIERQ